MEKNTKQLSKGAHDRIRMRNNFSDSLTEVQAAAEKADFLIQMIQEEWTVHLPTEEAQRKWICEMTSVWMLVDIIRDYTFKIKDGLQTVDREITRDNAAEQEEAEDGRS